MHRPEAGLHRALDDRTSVQRSVRVVSWRRSWQHSAWRGTWSSPAADSAACRRRGPSSGCCRHSARITLVNDVNFMLYTPLLPGAAAGTLEPRHVVVPLREQLERTDLRLGHGAGRRPGAALPARALPRGPRGGPALRPADRRAGLGLADAARPGPGRARAWASRRCPTRSRCATACWAAWRRPRRSTTRPSAGAWLTFVFVGAGYAGARGRRRAPGLRGRRARPLPALPHPGRPLRARRGAPSASWARSREPLAALRHRGAARARHGHPDLDHARGGHRDDARGCPTGASPDPDRGLDRRRQAAPGGRQARPAARRRRPDRAWTRTTCAVTGVPASGRSATRPPSPIRPSAYKSPTPPTAQHAIRQGRRVARNVAADARARPRPAVPLPHARRVRRHGARRGGRPDARPPVARRAGLVAGPHLPPGDDAEPRAASCACSPTGTSACCSAATPPSSASSATRRRSVRTPTLRSSPPAAPAERAQVRRRPVVVGA